MKTKQSHFTGYKLDPNYRYLKVWHFQLGPGPIPLAHGPLVGIFTVRCAKGHSRQFRYDHMRQIALHCFKLKLPAFIPAARAALEKAERGVEGGSK